ncbi:hypothetical protein QVD17_23187 [Tagetes erecta]|uniref:Uncharacterized protein n=1 Tax=Tagetes erecta TaxID=13708 RepID=A0AAD8KIP6_TARER|nr:hypothetical protein QVD17_23187 [Tagetes erecta]
MFDFCGNCILFAQPSNLNCCIISFRKEGYWYEVLFLDKIRRLIITISIKGLGVSDRIMKRSRGFGWNYDIGNIFVFRVLMSFILQRTGLWRR